MTDSEITTYNLDNPSDLAKVISLRCFKDCFSQARKSRNFDEETTKSSKVFTSSDGSSKKVKKYTIKGKGVASYRKLEDVVDYRSFVKSNDENEDVFEKRIEETDLFRKELLTLLSSLTTNKEILKYFEQGEMTRLGIEFSDSVAPEAYDFIINSLSKFMFDTIGLPSLISFSIISQSLEEPQVSKFLIPSQAGL